MKNKLYADALMKNVPDIEYWDKLLEHINNFSLHTGIAWLRITEDGVVHIVPAETYNSDNKAEEETSFPIIE